MLAAIWGPDLDCLDAAVAGPVHRDRIRHHWPATGPMDQLGVGRPQLRMERARGAANHVACLVILAADMGVRRFRGDVGMGRATYRAPEAEGDITQATTYIPRGWT